MGLAEAIQAAKHISQQPVRASLDDIVETAQKQVNALVISEDAAESIILDDDLRLLVRDAERDRVRRKEANTLLSSSISRARLHADEFSSNGELLAEIHKRETKRKQKMLDELEKSPFVKRDKEDCIIVQGTPIRYRYQLSVESLAAELQELRNREETMTKKVR